MSVQIAKSVSLRADKKNYKVWATPRNRVRCGFRNNNNDNNNNDGFRVAFASDLARAETVFLRIHGQSQKETPGVVQVGASQPNKKSASVFGKTAMFEGYACTAPLGV